MEDRIQKLDGVEHVTTWVGSGQLTFANALYFRDLPAAVMAGCYRPDDYSLIEVLKLASLGELFGYNDFAIEVLEQGRNAGVLDAEDCAMLSGLLPGQSNGKSSGGMGLLRAGVRAALPPALRGRLRRVVQGLISE